MNDDYKQWSDGDMATKTELRLGMADWIDGLADWQVIMHLTFSWEASLDSARRCYEGLMRRRHSDTDYFYAEELNPGRPGYHIHGLLHRPLSIYCKDFWAEWFEKYGRCRFELVQSRDDVVNYCAKYVTKERAWWNVYLVNSGRQVPQKQPGDLFANRPDLVIARSAEADRLQERWSESNRLQKERAWASAG